MEITDLFQVSRRPGFSIFCSEPLPDHEVVNQFYSSRNLNGVVTPWVDTTKRWATFSSTAITTIAAKTTTAQGYVSTIGNMTYFSDGASADLYKYDSANLSAWGLAAPTITPVSEGLGFWQPFTRFHIGNSILDPNGNVESVTSVLIPNGAFESPTYAATLALGGSLAETWTFDPVNGGYAVTMGYRFVQSGSGSSVAPTVAYTFPNVVTVGNSVVLVFGEGTENLNPTVVSVHDSLGNIYTQQATGTGTYHGGGGNDYPSTTWIWTAPITVGGTCKVTVVTSGVSGTDAGLELAAHEVSGINPTASTSANNYGVNVSSLTAGTVTFSGTALVLSSLLSFSSGADTGPSGYSSGPVAATGRWKLYDAFRGTTSPQSPIWSVPSGDGQVLGVSVVFPISTLTTGYSPYLFLGSLNLSIPTGAIILGIQVSIPKRNVVSGTIVDHSVKLVIGGAATGSDEASASAWSSSGYAVSNYGGPTDLWGLTPTAAQLNANGASGFGIAISAAITSTTGGSIVPEVGYVVPVQPTVTVFYKQASGLGGPGFSGANEPIWATSTGIGTTDGGLGWTNYGPILTWSPVTGYSPQVVIIDTNGNLQLSTHVANPIPKWDASHGYSLGNIVYFSGQYWTSVFNGTNTGVVPTVGYSVATTVSSVATTVPYWALTDTPLVTGLVAPVWNTVIGGKTTDGSYTWTNMGQGTGLAFTGYTYVYGYRTIYGHITTSSPFSNNTGAILGPLNATVTSYVVNTNVVTFTGNNNFISGDVFLVRGLTFGTYLNEQSFTVISAAPSESFPLTSVAVDGSDVLTILATNNLVAGQTVTFSALDTATFLNGITVTVLASGLSSSQFKANFTHASYGPTGDSGTVEVSGSYAVDFIHADTSLTLDSGVALPLVSTITGAGAASPLCNSTATITAASVTAYIVTITASNNFQPGLWVTLSGLTNATFLNSKQFQVIAVDQPIGTQNTWFQVFFETVDYAKTTDTGTATFDAIEIYRTSDGGGAYLFAGAVANPGTGPFSFDDFVVDADLDVLLTAPLAHQNDPPPGAPGSSIITAGGVLVYWQGRLWQANGNFVYFNAGPDCINGVPEEAWPPGNRFQFAGPVLNMVPTPDGVGLLIYLADRVAVILGGPETISFYASDALSNFGISNPNAIFRDGSIIGQFTTQKQYFELNGGQKLEIGEHISDYFTAHFDAAKTYATMHRDGLDVGVFVSNGVDRVLRYGSNIGAWSVPAFPACGAGALQSIETAIGVTSLMLASPIGGVTGSVGLFNPTSGTSVGAGTPWLTPSNITLGSPTQYATVTFALAAGSSQTLRAAYAALHIPDTAIVQGAQVIVVGKQSIPAEFTLTITPTNPVAGATSHTFSLGQTNTTVLLGGSTDLWGMPWSIPAAVNAGAVSFDIVATYEG